VKPEEGASLARALGPHWMVLMRRHGATVAGTNLRELTFRTVFASDNCKLQSEAMAHGHVDQLSPGEIELSAAHSVEPPSKNRAWDYWVRQVEKAGLMPARSGVKRSTSSPKRAAPTSAKGSAAKGRSKKRR
ncbi:MAG: class II aldolase/adducin family protein, partial [Pseudomonadota bacterium]